MFGDRDSKIECSDNANALSQESAMKGLEELVKESRGKAMTLAREVRTLRRQLDVYQDYVKKLENKKEVARSIRETLLDRLPPNNLTSEMALLGLYMKAPRMMEHFNQPYVNLMFYANANRIIHSAMMDLKGEFDLRILEDALKKRGEWEAIGGASYFVSVEAQGETAKPELAGGLIQIIEDAFLRRQIVHWCSERMKESWNGSFHDANEHKEVVVASWPEYIRRRAAEMLDLLPFRFRKTYHTPALVDEVLGDFDELVQRKGKPRISTSYKGLDRIMHGIFPGRLVMVGARTKIGKTTFSLNIADNIAEQGYHTLIFTYESKRSELIQKLISKHSGVDSARFAYWDEDKIPPEEIDKIRATAEFVKGLPIHFEGNPPDIKYICERTQHLKALYPKLALVIVDGLQSFESYVPYQGNKSDIYIEILKKLKNLADNQDLTVLVNAQLKIDVERRKDKKPKGLEDFSDCKGIPEIADTAFCLYRPEFYWPENENYRGVMEVIPMVMRVGGKREKGFRLGVDMRTSRVYELS